MDHTLGVGCPHADHLEALAADLEPVADHPVVDPAAADSELGASLGDRTRSALQGAAIQVNHQRQPPFNAGLERALGFGGDRQAGPIDRQRQRQGLGTELLLEADRQQEAAVVGVIADRHPVGQHARAAHRIDELLQGGDCLALVMDDGPQTAETLREAALDRQGGAVKDLGDREGAHHDIAAEHVAHQRHLALGEGVNKTAASQDQHLFVNAAATAAAGADALKAGQIDARLEEVDLVVDAALKGLGKQQNLVEPLVDKGQAAAEGIGVGDRLQTVDKLGEHQDDVH